MLISLSIRDVVLIERLELEFATGLTVLTGETGAGKSILLDALGLALGERSDSALVRRGAAQAIVSAEFMLDPDHPVHAFLNEQGLPAADSLMVRRVLSADGRSRGFINDQPVSIGLLKQLGQLTVEIQGQFDQHGLMDPAAHRQLFDAFAGNASLLQELERACDTWREAIMARQAAESVLAQSRADEEFLRHTLAELEEARPQPGEEDILAAQRTRLMHRAQLEEALSSAQDQLSGERGAQQALAAAARTLERVKAKAAGQLDEIAGALERAIIEVDEASAQLSAVSGSQSEADDVETIEARLFSLRGLARKYSVGVDALAAYRDEVAARLANIESGDLGLRELAAVEQRCRGHYHVGAAALTASRQAAVATLEAAVTAELVPLKFDRARFTVTLSPVDEAQWGPYGVERVLFQVSTNPGAPLGPLARIASGGELSRFLLALKVVLARMSSVPTIVFDEVDSGVGGAVADAVGDRLSRLGQELQILVVTHSPQVAARGDHHWHVTKESRGETAITDIERLDSDARREELARMLSGAQITDEARAAAARLLARTS